MVQEMEKLLSSFTKKLPEKSDENNNDESELIEDELKKMGYV